MDNKESDYMDDLFGESEPVQNDLFGDTDPVQVAVPALLTPKPVLDRLDELQLSGCCNKVEWSKAGAITYIGSNGRSVYLRMFCRSSNKEDWDLGEEVSLPIEIASEAPHLVHLLWNQSGTILAVFDACGRTALYANLGAFGRMRLLRNSTQDDEDDSARVIASYWLPSIVMKGMAMYIRSATRADEAGAWSFQTDYDRTPGPSHPIDSKSALICVTMSGKLRLLYDAGSTWAEHTLDLGIAKTCDDFLTHASFAPDKDGRLFLVAHNMSRQLQLFELRISWNETKQNIRGQQVITGLDPALEASTLSTIPFFAPSQANVDQSDLDPMMDWRDTSVANLTHLQLLPASFNKNWEQRICPLLIAVFSHTRNGASANPMHQEDFSVISQWELLTFHSTLHPTFNELNSKAKPAKLESSLNRMMLQKKPDVISNSHILDLCSLHFNNIVATALSDGSILLRDRATMEPILPEIATESVSSLPQAGFAYPISTEHLGLCFAFSTNGCIAVAMDAEGKLRLRKMEIMTDWSDDSQPEQPVIALTSQYAMACWYSWTNDDVLATVPRNTMQELLDMFLRYVYAPLGVSVDYATTESQKDTVTLFRFSTFARCLSAQNVLGNYHRQGAGKALPKKIAWAILNIRAVAITLGITVKNDKNISPLDPSVVTLISGITKWMLDLIAFMMDELFTLSDALRGHEISKDKLSQEIKRLNTPALHLMLQSIPRMLVRFNCQYLALALNNAHKTGQQAEDPAERRAIAEYLALFNEAPVKLHHFRRMIDEAEGWIKRIYNDSFGEEARVEAERSMLVSGALPDALMPVAKHLLTSTMERLRSEMDPAKIYFHDLRWLDLTDDQASEMLLEKQKYDVHMKKPIGPKARLRRCTRCRSLMDDTPNQSKVPSAAWLALLEKSCVCASNWMAVPET
ncbi:MAG: mediator complex subunit [Bathelium mastoideum]|nr:MAG: mediator complex subunit [Bathelium mastoideum]